MFPSSLHWLLEGIGYGIQERPDTVILHLWHILPLDLLCGIYILATTTLLMSRQQLHLGIIIEETAILGTCMEKTATRSHLNLEKQVKYSQM